MVVRKYREPDWKYSYRIGYSGDFAVYEDGEIVEQYVESFRTGNVNKYNVKIFSYICDY